jgi:hypothetical protein
MAEALEAGLVTDAAVAASIAQSQAPSGRLRENIPLAQAMEGKNIKHDIGRCRSHRSAAIVDAHECGTGASRTGHAHGGIRPPGRRQPALQRLARRKAPTATPSWSGEPAINAVVYDAVARRRRLDLGRARTGQLNCARRTTFRYKSPVELALMRTPEAAHSIRWAS